MPMSPAAAIEDQLRRVEVERGVRAADASLAAWVEEVKRFQHRRFQATYADLAQQPRYTAAARFFLDELYGPHDFSERDAQFARIVPALVRLFPTDIVATVRDLAELHALSEHFDTLMGQQLKDGGNAARLDRTLYGVAWRAVGQREERIRQIELMLTIGRALDRYTRNPLLRHSLRMMRAPARAAGLGALQRFLESGFDTFREMKGAEHFLGCVATRERALLEALFSGEMPSGEAWLNLPD